MKIMVLVVLISGVRFGSAVANFLQCFLLGQGLIKLVPILALKLHSFNTYYVLNKLQYRLTKSLCQSPRPEGRSL